MAVGAFTVVTNEAVRFITNEDCMIQLLHYNVWANERLASNILSVKSDSVFDVAIAPFEHVLEALRHITGAEIAWRMRIEGQSPSSVMALTNGRTGPELLDTLQDASRRLVEIAQDIPDLSSHRITYSTTTGVQYDHPASDILLHVVNHSTYHRGQIMSALRTVTTGPLLPLDYIAYVRIV